MTAISPQAATAAGTGDAVLEVNDLGIAFGPERALLHAVEDLTFQIRAGETLAIVGESGCGKSVTAMAIMGLLPKPGATITSGRVMFEGRDLTTLSETDYQDVRGNRIAMIFQEPMTALNPVMTIGRQIAEVLRRHRDLDAGAARSRALSLLEQVGIADLNRRIDQYPHEFSGGMRQRVMIAMALACDPSILIADEPTTALDVTVQAQILDLIAGLRERHGTSVLLITHDLGVVAEQADRAVVMYAGRVVETATVSEILNRPLHPYTIGLIGSIPRLGLNRRSTGTRLSVIKGSVPTLGQRGSACVFADRCAFAIDECRRTRPSLESHGDAHDVACLRTEEIAKGRA